MLRLKIIFSVFIILPGFQQLICQSNPIPFNLSSGDYYFNYWDSLKTTGTYPDNMIFHVCGVQDPGISDPTTNDYTSSYNLTSQSRINGLGEQGISFINTSSNGYLGTAVVSLGASNRSNLVVSFICGTIIPASNDRVYKIRLQYRIGLTSNWVDVPGAVEYISNSVAGHTQTFSQISLPTELNNQTIVQLRWKYFAVSGSNGTRPKLRLDDIEISSVPFTGTSKLAVININNGQSPISGVPFDVVVQAQDDYNNPQNVTQNTDVLLSLNLGNGTLTGNLTGTILAGTNSLTVNGIIYNTILPALQVYNISVPEPSGLIYNPYDSTLFTVSDGNGGKIYKLSLTGQILQQISVNSDDMEGVTVTLPYDTLFVVEERLRKIIKYNLNGDLLGEIPVNVSGPDNNGLEGIAINTNSRNYYVINQINPALIIELSSNGIELSRTEINFTWDLSDICYDPHLNLLWIVSSESHLLCKVSLDGQLLNKWKIPIQKPEGITIVNNNLIYITCDTESKIYIFNKP